MEFVMNRENVCVQNSLQVMIVLKFSNSVLTIAIKMEYANFRIMNISVYVKKDFTGKIANIKKKNALTNAAIMDFVIH